nr:uncharacterized protein CI109_003749 [Kwoniella shandongensis]KAA5527778.1 hypothetical protein CI109_003749 [Kwoniella shandongensis]
MPSLSEVLNKKTLRQLKPWATAAGLPVDGLKRDIIARLVANPAAVPPDVLSLASLEPPVSQPSVTQPPAVQPSTTQPGNETTHAPLPTVTFGPPPAPANDDLLAALSHLLDAKLAPQSKAIEELIRRVELLEQREGESSPSEGGILLPNYDATPSTADVIASVSAPRTTSNTSAASVARSLHRSVPPAVLEAILSNKFEIKDLWKLDPWRVDEVNASIKASSSSEVMGAVRDAFFPDANASAARTKEKYTSIASIVRPWIVLSQLRDLVEPGLCMYMITHALHLLTLFEQWKNFHAVYAYHNKVATDRINMGAALPREEWLKTDTEAITNYLIPIVSRSVPAATLPSRPPALTSSSTSHDAWDRNSRGNNDSKFGCRNWNAKQGVGFTPYGPSPVALGGSLQPALPAWDFALSSYPQPHFVFIVLSLIRNGATLGTPPSLPRVHLPEYSSPPRETDFLRAETARRLAEGEIAVTDPSSLQFCLPLAAVPKERSKLRAIHDLRALNDLVPKDFGYIAYSDLDDLLLALSSAPVGCFLWKVDLSNAFRHLRLCLGAQFCAGFSLDGIFYRDLCMPFGSRVAPFSFNLLAEALHWILLKCGASRLFHYLDDFYGFTTSLESARWTMSLFFTICSCLGISVNQKKCLGPSTRLIILGIEVDTVAMVARLDSTRVERIRSELLDLIRRQTGSRKELESMTGQLNFACRVIPLGRSFLSSFYSAISNSPPHPLLRRRLPPALLADLRWWLDLLTDWNGVRLLQPPPAPTVSVWTDASGLRGGGGHVGAAGRATDAFSYSFPSRHLSKDITFKELHAVLHAVTTFNSDDNWRGCHISFYIDNQAAVHSLRSGYIRNDSAQTLIRRFWLLAARGGYSFSTVWLSSSDNGLADALSRFDWTRAQAIDPTATNTALARRLDRSLVPHLSNSASFYLYIGIAESTRRGYEVAQRSYFSFISSSSLTNPFPATSTHLCEWVAWLGDKPTRPGTIRAYLAGLRSLHTDTGYSTDAFDSPQLDRIFRGVRRDIGQVSRRRRLPITLPVLSSILNSLLSIPIPSSDRVALAAAWSLAYVGAMRCGEITFDTFNPAVDIAKSDFTDFGDYATVRLPASKTDPFRKGVLITIPSAPPGAPVDPLNLLRTHVNSLPASQIPLFSRSPVHYLSRNLPLPPPSFPRSFFVDTLRRCLALAGLNASEYAGHSFRRGLATWAKLASGLDDGDIKLLGRWSSDAVKLYQESPTSHLANLARSTLRPSTVLPRGIIPPDRCWWGDESSA